MYAESENLIMNPKILVGCPTYVGKGYCLKEYAETVKALDYDNYDVILVDNSEGDSYFKEIREKGLKAWHLEPKELAARERIAVCRNLLRKMTLENYDYLLSLEQDVIPPKGILKGLLKHKKKIVSAVYNMRMDDGKNWPLLWRFIDKEEAEEFADKNPGIKPKIDEIREKGLLCKRYNLGELPKNKLIKIAACGLGAVLIHKDALKKIAFKSGKGKRAYDDMFFCQDAIRNGFEIFADTGVACGHLQDKNTRLNS